MRQDLVQFPMGERCSAAQDASMSELLQKTGSGATVGDLHGIFG